MAKVLAQLSSFFRVWPIPLHNTQPLTVEQLEEKYTVHCVHCHWALNKCFNSSQTLFLRKEHIFFIKLFLQKLIDFILLMKKCY